MEALLTSLLAPFLAYLLRAGSKATADAAGRLATATGKQAQAVWRKLYPSVQKRPAALEAAHDLANSPTDEDSQAAFRLQLKKILAEEPSLVTDLNRILVQTNIATGKGDVSIGDVTTTGGAAVISRDVFGGVHTSHEEKHYVGDRVSGATGTPLFMIVVGFLAVIVGFVLLIIGGLLTVKHYRDTKQLSVAWSWLIAGGVTFLAGAVIAQLGIIFRRD